MVSCELCRKKAKKQHRSVASIAPEKAQQIKNKNFWSIPSGAEKRMANEAPKEAPDESPNIDGDTKGLHKTACVPVPAKASPEPAIIASKVRGSLMSRKMTRSS